jgi:hypothetical protein
MALPKLSHKSEELISGPSRLLIAAYGFEKRSLGWVQNQKNLGIVSKAILIDYIHPKGPNLKDEMKDALIKINVSRIEEIQYDVQAPKNVEDEIEELIAKQLNYDEIIVDISAMTKLLILVILCKLSKYSGILRIIYTEAEEYAPTHEEFEQKKEQWELYASAPSRGVESIIRMRCLSSIRMQGQPVVLVAFASFNEQLIGHMLDTISPHRLIIINGTPPRSDYEWREKATHFIHRKMIEEYSHENPIDSSSGLLKRSTSTLEYGETFNQLNEIYKEYGLYERIICIATGSKMQTVGLFFVKIAHPDIHIEYLTPDSYFSERLSKGVRQIYEIKIPNYKELLLAIELNSQKIFNLPIPDKEEYDQQNDD